LFRSSAPLSPSGWPRRAENTNKVLTRLSERHAGVASDGACMRTCERIDVWSAVAPDSLLLCCAVYNIQFRRSLRGRRAYASCSLCVCVCIRWATRCRMWPRILSLHVFLVGGPLQGSRQWTVHGTRSAKMRRTSMKKNQSFCRNRRVFERTLFRSTSRRRMVAWARRRAQPQCCQPQNPRRRRTRAPLGVSSQLPPRKTRS
jgi:hypothetical protein